MVFRLLLIMEKKCFVPCCRNTSRNSDKIFVSVPREDLRRKRWFRAIGMHPKKTALFCCDDHFDLPEDSENWFYYLMTGKKLYLKKNVVPHLNLHGSLKHSNELQTESPTDEIGHEDRRKTSKFSVPRHINGGLLGYIQTSDEAETEKPHFECLVCPGIFYSDTELAVHFREHRKQSNFSCWQCGHESDSFILLREHYGSAHGMGLFKSVGEIQQPNRSAIEEGETTDEDQDCSKQTRSESPSDVPCPRCHLNFKSFDEYLAHQCSAPEEEPQSVEENNGLETPKLRNLLTAAKQKKKKKSGCDSFNKSSESACTGGDSSKARKSQTRSENKRIKEIFRKLLGADDYKNPYRIYNLLCNGCHLISKNWKDFYIHSTICDKIFKCNYCPFKTYESHKLELHSWTKHNIITYVCGYCNFGTAMEENFDQHMMLIHGQIRHEEEDFPESQLEDEYILQPDPEVEIIEVKKEVEEEFLEECGDEENVTNLSSSVDRTNSDATEMSKEVWLPAISIADQTQIPERVELREERIQIDSDSDLETLVAHVKDVATKEEVIPVAQASTNNNVKIGGVPFTPQNAVAKRPDEDTPTKDPKKIPEADSFVISDEDDESCDIPYKKYKKLPFTLSRDNTKNINEVGKRAAKSLIQKLAKNATIDGDNEDDCVLIAESGSVGRTARKRTEWIPYTLQKPLTAFELFTEQVKKQIRIQFPQTHPEYHLQSIGKTWRKLSKEQRWPFYVEARRRKSHFQCVTKCTTSGQEEVGTNSARPVSSPTSVLNEPIIILD